MTAYIQLTSMDLGRFRLNDYFATDTNSFGWWQLVGLPFLLGLSFIAVSIWGIRANREPKSIVLKLGICLLLAVLLLAVGSGWGIFASVCLVLLLVVPARAMLAAKRAT